MDGDKWKIITTKIERGRENKGRKIRVIEVVQPNMLLKLLQVNQWGCSWGRSRKNYSTNEAGL